MRCRELLLKSIIEIILRFPDFDGSRVFSFEYLTREIRESKLTATEQVEELNKQRKKT